MRLHFHRVLVLFVTQSAVKLAILLVQLQQHYANKRVTGISEGRKIVAKNLGHFLDQTRLYSPPGRVVCVKKKKNTNKQTNEKEVRSIRSHTEYHYN